MYKTSGYTFRLWGTTDFTGIQKHTSYKIVLGIISHRESKTSSRDNEKNINKRKDRQLAGQPSSTPFMSIKDSCNKRDTLNM